MGNTILVIGSTGKTGKRVFEKLQARNNHVVPATRNSQIPFNWYDQSTWASALKNINTIYITFQPDLAIPQAFGIMTAFVEMAKKQHVEKLVLLSGRGEVEAEACEKIIINSGLNYTIVRASFFMQNFSENFWLDGILSGEFVIPIITVREPFVDADDIADVVVASLINDSHNSKIYELTGPELLTFKDTINIISQKIDKEVKFVELEMIEYVQLLKKYKLPEDFIWLIKYLFTEVLDGRNESITNDVELITKRKPTSFDDYVEKTLATGVWNLKI